MALTETWLSNEDSKNKHVIDQCVAHGYTLHHSPRTSGTRGGGVDILVDILCEQCNQGDLQADPCKSSDYFIRIDALEADLFGVNIDRECTDVNIVVRLFWINMHHQNVFMLLTDICMIG